MAYADSGGFRKTSAPSLIASIGVNALLVGAIFFAAPDVTGDIPYIGTKIFKIDPDAPPVEAKKSPEKIEPDAKPQPFVAPKAESDARPEGTGLIIPGTGGEIVTGGGMTVIEKPIVPLIALPTIVKAKVDPRFAGVLQPTYPPGMIREGREGSVSVRVLIGTDGKVREVVIVSAESPEFAAATEKQALRKWRFIPATRDGAAIESWREMTVRFEIP